MRIIRLSLYILVLSNCTHHRPQGVNFLVVQKGDTLNHFYYQGQEKYEIVGNEDSITSKFKTQIQGRLVLGVQNRKNKNHKWLSYTDITDKNINNIMELSTKFMHDNYSIVDDYKLVITENYIDSTENQITKYETFAAIKTETNDTILFQEMFYVFKENNVLGALTVYDNLDTREEMRLSLNDAFNAIRKKAKAQH